MIKEFLFKNKIELRDVILGGQDGLVNVLGLSLGLFAAHSTSRVIIVAGLAAAFSESVSMGAVAYTSAISDRDRIKRTKESQIVFGSFIVLITALLGAFVPLVPFFFLSIVPAILCALILSCAVLFGFGVAKARIMGGSWLAAGTQILVIGIMSALAGFVIGLLLKVA